MKSWLPTLSLSFAAFIFFTSEFIPVGLITEIGSSFGRTESQTGILMTAYAWIVAVLSIPLTAYATRYDRRPLMLTLLAVFTFAHVISMFATNFEVLIFSRLFVASMHAIFWAIAIPLGIRLAPSGHRERAMSIVATGATMGGLLGIPLGTYFGQVFGWRSTFAAIGVCASVVGFILYRMLPPTPSQNSGNFRSIAPLLRRKQLVLTYLMTVIAMTGEHTIYTYISPYLKDVGGLRKEWVASVLLAFGCAGLIGSFFSANLMKRHFKQTALLSIAVVAFCMLIFRFTVTSYPLTILLVFVWGIAFMFFNLVLQNLVLIIAPDAEDVAMAGFSGIYNAGIGAGALIGSLVSVHSLHALGYIGAALTTVALLICIYVLRMTMPEPLTKRSH